MAKRKFSFSALVSNNKLVFFFALLVAIVLWVAVSPSGTRVISGIKVNIVTEGTPAGNSGFQVVSGQGQEVAVTISGEFSILNGISASDIEIGYSLADVNAAREYSLKLTAKPVGRSDFTITAVTPDTIKVRFDQSASNTFIVQPQAKGAVAETGKVAEAAVMADSNQNTIRITGPKTDIDRIVTVQAVAEVNKTMSQTESFPAKIVLLDKDNQEIDQSLMELSFQDPQITVQISKTKTVKVVPTFEGIPGYYQENDIPYELNVSEITVIGTPETVDEMTEIALPAIDFNTLLNKKNVFNLEVNLPLGVRSSDNVTQVTVTVDLSRMRTDSWTVRSFEAANAPADRTITVVTSSRQVTLVGNRYSIWDISSDDITLVYDLRDIDVSQGEHLVRARVRVDGYDNVWGVGEYDVQVRIE